MTDILTNTSKFLSLILRHKPETIGITLDEQGWVNVELLIEKYNETNPHKIDKDILNIVVKSNNKQRFEYSQDGSQIRARQGHSIKVDLGYRQVSPPSILYHGTATRFVDSIKKSGINKKDRHHVHLSGDYNTAVSVGQRHGIPHVLNIDCNKMVEDGYSFFKTENNVWLVESVPTKYITF